MLRGPIVTNRRAQRARPRPEYVSGTYTGKDRTRTHTAAGSLIHAFPSAVVEPDT
jgi:hypothetical protein